jgi:hypothetical protein
MLERFERVDRRFAQQDQRLGRVDTRTGEIADRLEVVRAEILDRLDELARSVRTLVVMDEDRACGNLPSPAALAMVPHEEE